MFVGCAWEGVLVKDVATLWLRWHVGGWVGGCNRVRVSVWVCTHSMCVGAVGAAVCAEWQSHSRVEDAKLADHLLHAADGPLLISVCELHYQTGGCSLGHRKRQKYWTKSYSKIIIAYIHINRQHFRVQELFIFLLKNIRSFWHSWINILEYI